MLSTRRYTAARCMSSGVNPLTPITLPTAPISPPPSKPILSPQADLNMASPTPTRLSFVVPPTRLVSPQPMSAAADPRSPVLSKCLSEDCDNAVMSERNTCSSCRNLIIAIVQSELAASQVSRPGSLSVSHTPSVTPSKPKKRAPVSLLPFPTSSPGAKSTNDAAEPTSPEALYFTASSSSQKRRHKRRAIAALGYPYGGSYGEREGRFARKDFHRFETLAEAKQECRGMFIEHP